MSQTSGTIDGWSHAEDDLLLQFLHVSQPGGRFEGSRESARWPNISANMTRAAASLGLAGSYSRDICAKRYSRYILPKIVLAALQTRHSPSSSSADDATASSSNASYNSVLEWITDLHMTENCSPQPGDTDLGDDVTWEDLLDWAVEIIENPACIFAEIGTVGKFDTSSQFEAAERNEWGFKSQYELEYFNEISGFARNIFRQDGVDEEKARMDEEKARMDEEKSRTDEEGA